MSLPLKIKNLILSLLALFCLSFSGLCQNPVREAINGSEGRNGFNLVTLGPGKIKLMSALVKDKQTRQTLKNLDRIQTLSVPMSPEGVDFLGSLGKMAKSTYMHLADFHDQNADEYDIYLLFSGETPSQSLTPEDLSGMPDDTLINEILIIRPLAGTVMLMEGKIPLGANLWNSMINP